MAVEEAAQEIGRQESAFGADSLEFLADLGQCFRSDRSGRIGTSDTQTIDK